MESVLPWSRRGGWGEAGDICRDFGVVMASLVGWMGGSDGRLLFSETSCFVLKSGDGEIQILTIVSSGALYVMFKDRDLWLR